MDGAGRQLFDEVPKRCPKTLLNLTGGLVRESDGADRPRVYRMTVDQEADAAGQTAGLSGAGAGQSSRLSYTARPRRETRIPAAVE